jgi:hypothetical protein
MRETPWTQSGDETAISPEANESKGSPPIFKKLKHTIFVIFW